MGVVSPLTSAADPPRPRARDLGIEPGVFPPGPLNAITDVAGVRVGHVTLNQGENVRTGVTAILPHGGNLFQEFECEASRVDRRHDFVYIFVCNRVGAPASAISLGCSARPSGGP